MHLQASLHLALELISPMNAPQTMNAPHFIVVGAHKAGTTSLHHYLNQHPDIFLPSVKGADLLCQHAITELENAGDYLAQFDAAETGQMCGEVSSVYLHAGKPITEKIKRLFPTVKIIAMLRNPIDRTYSHALWARSYAPDEVPHLDELILNSKKFLSPGLYATHLKQYFSCFGRDQIKLIRYDDFQNSSSQLITELYRFIGVDDRFTPDISRRHHSGTLKLSNSYNSLLKTRASVSPVLKALIPKPIRGTIRNALYRKSHAPKPLMSRQLRLELVNYFRDEIMELKELTNLDVLHWLDLPEPSEG